MLRKLEEEENDPFKDEDFHMSSSVGNGALYWFLNITSFFKYSCESLCVTWQVVFLEVLGKYDRIRSS
jgi:hypothetical protein